MIAENLKKQTKRIIYLIAFLTSVHYALIVYINSSFLERYVAKENLGLLYMLASLFSILIIVNLPKALKKWGQFKAVLTVLFLDLLAVIGLAIAASPLFQPTVEFPIGDSVATVQNTSGAIPLMPLLVVCSFLIFQCAIILNRVLLDIYLEEFSKEKETGNNRGWFLTAMNVAFVLAPFTVGRIVGNSGDGFWIIYSISAIFLMLSLCAVYKYLKHIKEVATHSPPALKTLAKVARDKNLLNIFTSAFLLEFFYSWMVIYTPIYLNKSIGFSWAEIGIIFSAMLTAFVILELPLGRLADRYLGEKEILTSGYIVAGVSTVILAIINSKSVLIWSIALFMTRVGASAIEIMNDTYFFKKISASDSDVIGLFRNMSPVAYIIGPLLGSGLLYLIDYRYLFIILGIVMISGIKFSISIKDTL